MSFASDIARAVRDVILLNERVNQNRTEVAGVASELKQLALDQLALDRRVFRLETLLDVGMATRRGPPRLTE